jgi:hypothetical protein
MGNELQNALREPDSNAEVAATSTPASLPPRAGTPPPANLYDSLKDGQIRLFALDLETTGNIVGRLETVELSSAPPFYALSYVCGSEACGEKLTINDHDVLVKPNLSAALKELWLYFNVGNAALFALWIDAICIDQGNEEEKAKQIRNMHGIFSGAEEVFIWLGAVDDNIRMVLRVFAWIGLYRDIKALQQHHSEPGDQDSIEEPKMKAMRSLDLLQGFLARRHSVSYTNLFALDYFLVAVNPLLDGKPDQFVKSLNAAMDVPILNEGLFPPNHVFWASLYGLLNLEWFGRTWTFQETQLAQEARLFARGVCVPWRIFVHSMDALLFALMFPETSDEGSRSSRLTHLPPPDERRDSINNWFQFATSMSSSAIGMPLLPSLIITKRRVSTIAKDKVYGLIALWRSKIQAEIIIDYTRATGEVFASAVKLGLMMEEEWTIADLWTAFDDFGRPPQSSLTEGLLPSWCPDFHHSTDHPYDADYGSLSLAVVDRIKAFVCYEHTCDSKTISIRVLMLDTISKRTEIACPRVSRHTLKEHSAALTTWFRELLEVFSSDNKAKAGRSLRDDMKTFLYEDVGHVSEITLDQFSESLEVLACVSPWQSADVLQEDSSLRQTLSILSRQFGRFFFLTDSGRRGYSARQPSLEGHIILVPRGDPRGPLHMLTADCTQYAGCASVLGFMGDSLLESLDDMETKWEMVCLK